MNDKMIQELLDRVGINNEQGCGILLDVLSKPGSERNLRPDDEKRIAASIERAYTSGKLYELNEMLTFEAVTELPTAAETIALLRMILDKDQIRRR